MKRILSSSTKSLLVILLLATSVGCTAKIRKARYLSRADSYLKAGDFEKAKIEYLNVLRFDRQNAVAFAKIGYIWFEEGDPIRSAAFLLRAKELDAKDFDNRVRLGRVQTSAGDYKAGRKEALSILQEDPGNGDALVLLTETDRSAEDVTATEEQLKKFPDKNKVTYHLAAANIALHQNDTKTADTHLQAAVKADPKYPAAHLAAAIYALLQKDKTRGVEELRAAANLAPMRSTERMKLAEYLNDSGAKDEAKAQLKEITSKTPDFFPAWRLLAQIALNEQQYDEGLSDLDNLFSRDPDNVEATMLQAQLYLGKKDNKKAIDVMERIAKVYAASPLIKYQLGRTYMQTGNFVQAASVLTEAVAAQPDFYDAALLLAETNVRSHNPKPVIPAMLDLLKKRPGVIEAQLFLAEAYRQDGQLDAAAEIYRQLSEQAPTNPQALLLLGSIQRVQRKTQEARETFEKALALAPESILAADQLIDLELVSRDYHAADERAQQLLAKNPSVAPAHYLQAKVAAAQTKWDQAEAEAKKAIEINGNYTAAYDLLISCYIAENKMPQAIKELESVLAKTPENPSALLTSALIYEKLNDYTKARDAYEKLLAVQPTTMLALNNLAYLYTERFNQLDRASELARKARELQPTDAATADTLGWILYKQGDYAQAVKLLDESAAKQPDAGDVQYHDGMARYMMGEVDGARAALERAVSSSADYPGKKEAQERLATLREHPEQVKAATPALPKTSGSPAEAAAGDVVSNMRQAELAEKQGDFARAVAEYEAALKANPKLLPVIIKLAQINAGPLHNKTKALDYAKKARAMDSTDPKIAGQLGMLAYQTGNYPWAYSLLQESTRSLSDDPALLHSFAWAAYSVGHVSDARDAMQKVVDSFAQAPEAADAKRFVGMINASAADADAAAHAAEVSDVLKTDSTYAPALMARAAVQTQGGETKAAISTYNEVLKQFPDFVPAQKELAALSLEDPAELNHVYEFATKARQAMPDDAAVARTLGIVSYKRKDYSRATQLLAESNRKVPLDPTGLYYLGMANLQARQEAAARTALEQSLAAGLKEPRASETKKALEDLQARQQKAKPTPQP